MLCALVSLSCCRLVHEHEERAFVRHMREHGHIYTGSDYHFRLGVFLTHSRHVREFNRAPRSFRIGMTSLATLTPAEYRSLSPRSRRSSLGGHSPAVRRRVSDCPPTLDWRDTGAVPAVGDLIGGCGASWAYWAVRAVASQHAILHTTLYDLSMQDLVDCDYYDYGCMGGEVITALQFAIDGQGGWFTTEALYPWVGSGGPCTWDASTMQTVQIRAAAFVKSGDEGDLLQAVCGFGPVAVEVDGASLSFQLYTGGIFDDPGCSTMDVDTGLLAIGYGTEGGVDYWLCQNNWGTAWGEQGYIRMVRNKGNECGIATEAVYPIAV